MEIKRFITGIFAGAVLFAPVISFADTSLDTNTQIQALLQQLIAILEAELQALLAAHAQNPSVPVSQLLNIQPITIPSFTLPLYHGTTTSNTNPFTPPTYPSTTGNSCFTPSGGTVPDGQTYSTNDWCPLGSMAVFCGAGPRICRNGYWNPVTQTTTSGSCTVPTGATIPNGQIYTTNNDCAHSLAMICPPPTTLICQNGQLVPQSSGSTGASCTTLTGLNIPNGGTYTTGNDCAHSLAMYCPPPSTLVCRNGQLLPTPGGSSGNTGGSCTTPWGQTVQSGQTASGFCPPFPSEGVCGLSEKCQDGQWISPFGGAFNCATDPHNLAMCPQSMPPVPNGFSCPAGECAKQAGVGGWACGSCDNNVVL